MMQIALIWLIQKNSELLAFHFRWAKIIQPEIDRLKEIGPTDAVAIEAFFLVTCGFIDSGKDRATLVTHNICSTHELEPNQLTSKYQNWRLFNEHDFQFQFRTPSEKDELAPVTIMEKTLEPLGRETDEWLWLRLSDLEYFPNLNAWTGFLTTRVDV